MKPFYHEFEQTSDLGIEVSGLSLENLFENAVYSLFDLMVDGKNISDKSHRKIELKADNRELLLRELLSELLYLFQTKYFIVSRINITDLDDKFLTAEIYGEIPESEKYSIKREIKAITYHQLNISQTKTGYVARFVMDI